MDQTPRSKRLRRPPIDGGKGALGDAPLMENPPTEEPLHHSGKRASEEEGALRGDADHGTEAEQAKRISALDQ